MSFAVPIALLLLLPLGGFFLLSGLFGGAGAIRLPGRWQDIVAPDLRAYVAQRSNLAAARKPVLCFAGGVLLVAALARPGLDARTPDAYATLAGRVIVLDVGSDLAPHRSFMDDLYRADPDVATAVIASSGDAYRIVPFTTDKSQIDRYVRVLQADMMPKPGQAPHIALAQAERSLDDAGYLVRQVIVLSARPAPERNVEIPPGQSRRFVIALGRGEASGWADWASRQRAKVMGRGAIELLSNALREETRATLRSEIPSARTEITTALIGLAALLWLLLFRRQGT